MNIRLQAVEKAKKSLKKTTIGLERETLRVTEKGLLSKTPHPKAFGSPLTHPYITCDYAQAQLELVTEPYKSLKDVRDHLGEIHSICNKSLASEMLWPLSMPSSLARSIQIADFGDSEKGLAKVLYREGLKERYGQNMQMISGIHYNISYPEELFQTLHAAVKSPLSLADFTSETYLHISRNILRYGWIITYLYGASPTCDDSYGAKGLQKFSQKTRYMPHATSLRMSTKGYYSRIQQQLAISYNTTAEFVQSMRFALKSEAPQYKKLKKQLNTSFLQTEGEWYTRVRPKPTLDEIEAGGIKYLELRSIDIDPFDPLGIGTCQMKFLELFILFCLVKNSPKLSQDEVKTLCKNQNDVAMHGRHPALHIMEGRTLKTVSVAGKKILKEMEKLTHLLPLCNFEDYIAAIENPSLTTSGRILSQMQKEGHTHTSFGMQQAQLHHAWYEKNKLSKSTIAEYETLSEESVLEEGILKKKESYGLAGYEDMEMSTQILLRVARKNNIAFRILDRKENVVEFSDGKTSAIVKQATKTHLDSYIDVEIMGSKALTKKMLAKEGFSVPLGATVYSIEEGMNEIAPYIGKPTVIKPNETNYGTAVHIFKNLTRSDAKKALLDAFTYDSTVLIEPYVQGTEYRFLVIKGECVGIIEREPAHIVGDGKKTVLALVKEKNNHPLSMRSEKERIQLDATEKRMLKESGLNAKSILKKGEKVYLRMNSNFSTGGDAHDRTDTVHTSYKKIACDIAAFHEVTFAGIDMIIPNCKRKGAYSVIETNYNPMLASHAYPSTGKARPVGERTLQALGFNV